RYQVLAPVHGLIRRLRLVPVVLVLEAPVRTHPQSSTTALVVLKSRVSLVADQLLKDMLGSSVEIDLLSFVLVHPGMCFAVVPALNRAERYLAVGNFVLVLVLFSRIAATLVVDLDLVEPSVPHGRRQSVNVLLEDAGNERTGGIVIGHATSPDESGDGTSLAGNAVPAGWCVRKASGSQDSESLNHSA